MPYRLIKAELSREIITEIPSNTFAPNIIISGALCSRNIAVLNIPVAHENRKTVRIDYEMESLEIGI
jgi:hypothetical protein